MSDASDSYRGSSDDDRSYHSSADDELYREGLTLLRAEAEEDWKRKLLLRKKYVHDLVTLEDLAIQLAEVKIEVDDIQPSSKDMIWVFGAYFVYILFLPMW